MRRRFGALGGGLVLVLLLTSVGVVRAQEEVGTAAAVNPSAQARGQGGSRTIMIGQSIVHRERIQTTSAGSVQLLFIDKTSMTIGPNSDLAIDEYIYDPKANTGRLSATLAKGVMRFVGGQVSHTGSAQINTPNGVVGIRGGVGIIGTNHVFIGYGRGTVTSTSGSVSLEEGEYTQMHDSGGPPTRPGRPPPGLIAAFLRDFQSQGNQGGGAPVSPGAVDNARQSVTGSSSGPVVTSTPPTGNTQPRTQQNSGPPQQFTQTIIANTQLGAVPPPAPPTPTQTPQFFPAPTLQPQPQPQTNQPVVEQPPVQPDPTPPPPFSTGRAFTFSMGNCCGTGTASNVPYMPAGFATGTNNFVSQGIGYRPETSSQNNQINRSFVSETSLTNHNGNSSVQATPTFFQWGLGITGSGASQSSWFSVATGTLEGSGDGTTISGGFGATRRGAGNQSMGRASGFFSSTAGSVTVDDQGVPLGATVTQQDYVAATNTYRNVMSQFSLGGTGGSQSYGFTQQMARTVAPAGLGEYRPQAVLSGWTGGLMQTVSGQSVSAPFATTGVAQIALDPARARVQATFDVVNVTPQSLDSFLLGTFSMGSLNTSRPAQSSYVDYNNFAARETVVVSPGSTQRTQVSTVNLQRVANSSTVMVNVPRDAAAQMLPNTTVCNCEYTRWGFWSTDTQRSGLFGGSRNDRGHLMTFVAGDMPNAVDVPKTGIATYTGHVVANVANNGAQYIASGNLSNTVDFGARSGTARVTGFDGANYQGTLRMSGNDPRYFDAGLAGNVGNRVMLMNGNFFRGAQGPVGEMGGNVTVLGRNYLGSGIFAGSTSGPR